MSSNIYDFFTDSEVLKSREPEYFKCTKVINIGSESDEELERVPTEMSTTTTTTTTSNEDELKDRPVSSCSLPPPAAIKTFVSILDEGCKKYYDGKTPIYAIVDCPDRADMFTIQCELRNVTAIGRAKTKKAAKQLAAKNILLKMVEKGLYQEFGLGDNQLSSISYLKSLMPELTAATEEETEGPTNENWVGKINEKCQRLKQRQAEYDLKDIGTEMQHLFVATCTVCKLTASGQGRTKKAAKMAAAHEMYKKLEASNDWIEAPPDALASELAKQEIQNSGNTDDNPASSEEVVPDTDVPTGEPEEAAAGPEPAAATLEAPAPEAPEPAPEDPEPAPLKESEQPNDTPIVDGTEATKPEDININTESVVPKTVYEVQKQAESSTYLGATLKLQELLNATEPSVEGVFPKQDLLFTILNERDINGDFQCMLKIRGAKGEVNVFGGTGQTEQMARDYASHAAFVYLYRFMR